MLISHFPQRDKKAVYPIMKHFKIYSSCILMLILCCCHKDHQVAAQGEQAVDVYVYGSLWHGSSAVTPTSGDAVYYKNGLQVILNAGGNGEPSTYVLTVNSLAVSGDTVYAGGSSTHNSSYSNGSSSALPSTPPIGPVYWINGVQHVLPVTNTLSPIIVGIAANSQNFYTLYQGVPFTGTFKLGGIAINGSIKYQYNDDLNGLIVSGQDLYTYGNTFGGDSAIYYKNNQPVKFQLPANTDVASITSMCISGHDVYACGFLVNNNAVVPVYWKNGQLTILASTKQSQPSGIAVQGENVYVSGYQVTSIDASGLTKQAILWKNGVMTVLSPPGSDSYTNGVVVSGNDVYVGGRAGPDSNCTAYWKNGIPVNFKIPTGYAFFNRGITVVPKK
jgi:hypothetical protein